MKYYLIRVLDTANIGCDNYVELTKEELKYVTDFIGGYGSSYVIDKIRKVLK